MKSYLTDSEAYTTCKGNLLIYGKIGAKFNIDVEKR